MIEFMEEARQLAAQCWTDRKTEHKEMDPDLAEAVAKRIANLMASAAQFHRNADYYRGLVQECGEAVGKEAYIQDDGGIVDEVLCAKVPELVVRQATENARLKDLIGELKHMASAHMGRGEMVEAIDHALEPE